MDNALISMDVIDAAGAGMYLVFGILQIDLWFRRRWANHLWLAGAAGSALLVNLTGMVVRHVGPGADTPVITLNALGVTAACVCLFELVQSLVARTPGRIARLLEALLFLVTLFAGLGVDFLVPVTMVGCGVMLVVSMFHAVRSGLRRGGEFTVIAGGFIVLVVLLVLDVAAELTGLDLPSGLPIVGFAVLFFSASHTLNRRFRYAEVAARTDPLTGLSNRRRFYELSDLALAMSRRSGKSLSLVLLDLDRFKLINDTYGHAAGDAVLQRLAELLRHALRRQDVAARWGGEEFILLLPDTDCSGARHVAETIRRQTAALSIASGAGEVAVTVSAGVAEHDPAANLDATIERADNALYRAKLSGRNQVEVARPELRGP